MRTTEALIAMAAVGLACGCGNGGGGGRGNLPPAPENGVQFVLPEMTVPASTETMMCWYVTLPSETDVWVRAYEVFQGEGGHHLVGFVTPEDEPDGTVKECTEPSSMFLWQPLLTGSDVKGFDLPDGYAVKVPGGSRLVFQSHYVNAGDAPVKIRDVANLTYADEIAGLTPVGSFANTTLSINIPADGQSHTTTYECPVPQTMNVFLMFGHMHEHGRSISISAGPAGALETLYEIDPWIPEFRDTAPAREWPMDAPLVLQQDDVLRVSCTWQNDGTDPLGFPQEMCASLLWVFPTEDPLVCTASPL